MEATHACCEMGWGPQSDRVRSALPARESLRRHEFSRQRRKRRLSDAERLGPSKDYLQETARDGLDLWRRLHGRKHIGGAAGRHAPGAEKRSRRFDELPLGHFRVFRASPTGERVWAKLGRQLRPDGSISRVAMGA